MIPEGMGEFFKYCTGHEPYDYQLKYLLDKSKRKAFRSGRQVGKTTTVVVAALHRAIHTPDQTILIISPFQRQSNIPFRAIRDIVENKKEIKNRVGNVFSATKLFFKNGSKIYSLPAGRTGASIRGYSPNMLIIDEAAYVPDDVWAAILPSLFKTGGDIVLTSTPKAMVGLFYEAFENSSEYSTYHVPCQKCPGITEKMINKFKKDMIEADYNREVLGEFIQEADNYFPMKLIEKCIFGKRQDIPQEDAKYRLAVDFARYGTDETVYIIGEFLESTVIVIHTISTKKMPTTHAIEKIKELHKNWNFDMIYLDESSMGGTIVDILLEAGLPIVGCIFSYKKKAEYYKTLKFLMENGRLKFYREPKLIDQLSRMIVNWRQWGPEVNAPIKKHDDYPDALALLCRDMKEVEEEIDDGFVF